MDNQLDLRFWVEPLTGEIIKLQESCYSADYVLDTRTGRRLFPLSRWSNVSVGDDVIRNATRASSERIRYLWISIYAPLTGLVCGLLLIVGGTLLKRKSNEAQA